MRESVAGVSSQQLAAEQIGVVFRTGMIGATVSLIVSTLYALLVWPTANHVAVAAWWLALNGIGALRFVMGHRVRRRPVMSGNVGSHGVLLIAIAALSGLCWAYAATALYPHDNHDAHFMAAMVVTGMPAGAVASFGPWFPALAGFVLAVIVPFSAHTLLESAPEAVWTAMAAIAYVAFLLRTGLWIEGTIRDNIAKRMAISAMADNLTRARDAAEAANRAKSRFLANMSHEIRTPLNAVIGVSEMMLETQLSAQQRHYSATIRDSALALLDILNDVLDTSRIEAGRFALREEPFRLTALLRDIDNLMRPAARRKGLEFGMTLAADVPDALIGDGMRVRQVLTNLVGNAIKFTESGLVGVAIGLEPGARGGVLLRFTVTDTGIGIAPQDRGRLFQPFSQIDSGSQRQRGGSGLGLRICAELARLMGGEIGFTSEPGVGSTFWFTARLRADAGPSREPAPAPRLSQAVTPRVLLVEDNTVNLMVARAMLESLGCAVTTAIDGRHAVELAAGQPFDLVLMDCEMPAMDGFAAAREIRRLDGPEKRLPIVALSANATDAERDDSLAAGMDDILVKPLLRESLAATIARWMPSTDLLPPHDPLPPTGPVAPGTLDLAAVHALRSLDGARPGLMRETIRRYLEQAPLLAREIIAAPDAIAVERAALSLKELSARIGARRVAGLAAAIEAAGRGRALADVGFELRELESAVESACGALRPHAG